MLDCYFECFEGWLIYPFGYTFVLLRYYEGLQKCLGLYSENGKYKSEEVDQLDALYQSLSKQYNWSSAAKVRWFLQK